MKKALITILVIILIAGAGVGGYFYGNSQKKENKTVKKETTKEEVKEEILDITDPIVEESFNKIMQAERCNISPLDYILKKDNLNASDITNKEVIEYYFQSYGWGESGETTKLSEEKLLNKVHSILGNDYKFELKTYDNFKYDKASKQFIITKKPWGCIFPGVQDLEKISKAVIKGDQLIITYKILFAGDGINWEENDKANYLNYYNDYNKKKLIPKKDIEYDNGDEYNNYRAEDNAHNYSLGSTYQFTFEKQDGEYVFVNSKLMK